MAPKETNLCMRKWQCLMTTVVVAADIWRLFDWTQKVLKCLGAVNLDKAMKRLLEIEK